MAAIGDHPRGCGEKSIFMFVVLSVRGSSPRVRGEGGVFRPDADELGIIPAGAGRRRDGLR